MSSSLQSVTVVGAGAVGIFFGAMLARAGRPVTLIGRANHVEAIRKDGIQLRMAGKQESIPAAATTDIAAVSSADLVLFCVKSTDTDSVAREIAPLLRENALVLSLQNGVDNAATIAHHIRQTVVPAVVYVATEMAGPGIVEHKGRGDLVIGPLTPDDAGNAEQQHRLQEVVDLFAEAAVPVVISAEVIGELWSKLLINCACNAISAVSQMPYGRMLARPEIRAVMRSVVREVVAVAQADGQALSFDTAMDSVERIVEAMPNQLSSTAQDIARGKPTEIDHLNGFVMRRGAELRVPTPVNQTLHALVKLAESGPPTACKTPS